MDRCEIAVVGAGLVGASLAAALAGRGLALTLLDAEPPVRPHYDGWDSRIYAVSPGSQAFLRSVGAWEHIAPERIAGVEAMEIFGDAGQAELRFSAYECDLPQLCCIVEGRELGRALSQALAARGSDPPLIAVPRALAIDDACIALELEGGRTLEAALVVGADGPRSWLREAAGIEHESRGYGQTAVVANFETELAHRATARQWFLADGVLALLPLPSNRVSLVWSTAEAHADRLLAAEPDDLAREVQRACGGALGEMRLLGAAGAFPLQYLRVREVVRPRLALIGDAAHVIHPLAGQGLNLGFGDAAELARVLIERGPQDDLGDFRLLRRYARARHEAVTLMQWTTDALQRLFSSRVPGARWLRNAGLGATDSVLPLKKLLVERALA